MKLSEIVHRPATPAPWSEGDNIPWNEPDFSERMLKEHLSQRHNAASRRFEIIDQHVHWIHHTILREKPTRVLDLACGPGLYTSRLAKLGHVCHGIDYSPASIRYARETATREQLACTYTEQDLRVADFGNGYGLVMLLFGEFNIFRPADIRLILAKANHALDAGGILLLEPHTFAAIQKLGQHPAAWHAASAGLFSDQPYICLDESHWDGESKTATRRYYVIDAGTGEVTRHAHTLQAYTDKEYHSLLSEFGFGNIKLYPSLCGRVLQDQADLVALDAQARTVTHPI